MIELYLFFYIIHFIVILFFFLFFFFFMILVVSFIEMIWFLWVIICTNQFLFVLTQLYNTIWRVKYYLYILFLNNFLYFFVLEDITDKSPYCRIVTSFTWRHFSSLVKYINKWSPIYFLIFFFFWCFITFSIFFY